MKKVGEITHAKSGIVTPFYLDGVTFRCTCLERVFSAPEAKILEAKVRDYVEHWLTLDWHPVICVESAMNDGWGGTKRTGLWVSAQRLYLSRSPAGAILSCEWDADPVHRKALAHTMGERELRIAALPLGAPLKIGSSKTWMDYTDAKWEALKAIMDGIDKLSVAITQILTTSEGNKRLEAMKITDHPRPLLEL